MRSCLSLAVVAGFIAAAFACTNPSPTPSGETNAAVAADAAATPDASTPPDAAVAQDASQPLDAAGSLDASARQDASADGGVTADAGDGDAATPGDAGQGDGGPVTVVVDCSEYATAEILDGDALVQDALDMAQLAPYRCIRGGLTINNTALTHLNGLGALEVVTGQFMVAQNLQLSDVTGLQNLRQVGHGFLFLNNALVTTLALTGLDALNATSFQISNNTALASLRFPSVVQLTQLHAQGNTALTTLEADLLSVAGGVSIQNNNALGAVVLPALRHLDPVALPPVFDTLNVHVAVLNNAGLTAIQLPSLEDANVFIQGNTVLTTLEIPNLARGGADIISNPALPDCEAIAVCAAVGVPENRCLPNDNPCLPDPCAGTACMRDCSAPLDHVCQ